MARHWRCNYSIAFDFGVGACFDSLPSCLMVLRSFLLEVILSHIFLCLLLAPLWRCCFGVPGQQALGQASLIVDLVTANYFVAYSILCLCYFETLKAHLKRPEFRVQNLNSLLNPVHETWQLTLTQTIPCSTPKSENYQITHSYSSKVLQMDN